MVVIPRKEISMNKIYESQYVPQLTIPSKTNKFYLRNGYGGYSPCIAGSPERIKGSVLANCVGYCFMRWWELADQRTKVGCIGSMTKPTSAYMWYTNTKDGYQRSKYPKLGAIACWKKVEKKTGKIVSGHVAITEHVAANGLYADKVSESGYGTYSFRIHNYGKNMNKGENSQYKWIFQGYILPPFIIDDPKSKDELAKGDKVKIIAKGNARADGKGKVCNGVGLTRYVLTIVKGSKYPYRIGNSKGVVTGYYKASALKKG